MTPPEQSDGYSSLDVDPDAIDRGVEALCRFIFPGVVVPRHEMAHAVLIAASGAEDWRERLPAKRAIE